MYSRGVKTNGILFLAKNSCPTSLPVVLLFGKMNGVRREQNRVGTQLESVQRVWDVGVRGTNDALKRL